MNSIIICNNNIKKKILKDLNNKPLCNIKFMTKREFIHNYYFDYDNKTIYYLMNKYQYKYDIALEYLNNLYYVEDQDYQNDKLNKLVYLKKELDDHNLLIYNSLFKKYLKDKKIIFMDYLNKYDMHYIDELKAVCNIEIKKRNSNNYKPDVYEFNTIDEEVEYVAYKICELIDKEISIDKIKLVNVNDDYLDVINRIFKLYNLKLQDKINLFGMDISKYFITNYSSNINNTINLLKEKYDSHLVNIIIDIVNRYNFIDDYMKIKDLIIEEIKRTTININYTNQIDIINYEDIVDDDEYIFFLNFNEESVPKKYQDIDYINDNIKPSYLETTKEKNKISSYVVTNFIRSVKNLTITYKLKTNYSSFYPSSLINDLHLEVKKEQMNDKVSYSTKMNNIKTCIKLDNYYKYGIKDKILALYNYNYPIDYHTYSNKYTKITDFKDDIVLSYTSMDNYYKCGFRYYLEKILKLKKDNNPMNKYIGSIFHYVLEKSLYQDIDYKKLVNEYLINNDISLNIKERYFLNKLTKELPSIIKEIKNQDKYINLKKRLYEEKVIIDFGDSKFIGIIDKVIYDNNTYAIIDYKTGHTDIDLRKIKYGIGMQLPVYLYLAHKKFNGNIAGFYLNQILHGNIKYNSKLSYEDQYKNNLKLYGYSNTKYIGDFDNSYQDSKIIKSLKIKNDGNYYNYSKILTDSEINDMIELVEDKIIACIDDIKKQEFNINPKNINGKNVSCEYCPYEDICFKSNEDIEWYTIEK